jgi:nucleotide-binding universal stress UspA family protein
MSSGVVIGYDGSDCAKAALRVALEVGKAYGEKVTIAFGYGQAPLGAEMRDYDEAVRDIGHKRVAEAIEIAKANGSEVEAVVMAQAPAPGLADLATERDARVIVVGSHGESPLRGALIGSTPHKLLHIADRPVLVVPVREE